MADQRIKGQEVSLILVQDNVPLATITDVRSMEVEIKLEMLEEGYLGETTDRYDEIYKGVRGSMELHFENQDVFNLFDALRDRARRRVPGTQINSKSTLVFPNGQKVRFIMRDVFFGPIPMTFGSRSDYGVIKLDFSCSDYGRI